jgi:hypothetical protein
MVGSAQMFNSPFYRSREVQEGLFLVYVSFRVGRVAPQRSAMSFFKSTSLICVVIHLFKTSYIEIKLHAAKTCRSALFRELCIATQLSIARDIIERSGRLPEHVSAQLST